MQINPDAPTSRHTHCPALAADLSLGGPVVGLTSQETWAVFGGWWKLHTGGRWGGDFKDLEHQGPGINRREMNHFDM